MRARSLNLQASMLRSMVPRLAFLAFSLGISFVFFIQLCDLVFDCGCRALWNGAAEACNIHDPVPPHCPWCADGGRLGQWSFGVIVAAQVATVLWPGRFGLRRAVAAILAFPAVGAAAGWASGLVSGYWR